MKTRDGKKTCQASQGFPLAISDERNILDKRLRQVLRVLVLH